MKRSLQLLAVLALTSTGACASLPGASIVPRPEARPEQPQLPVPTVCRVRADEPTSLPLPTLPPEEPAVPGRARPTDVDWLQGMLRHFQSRTLRAEVTQSYAVNVADEERRVRLENATNQNGCADQLEARE